MLNHIYCLKLGMLPAFFSDFSQRAGAILQGYWQEGKAVGATPWQLLALADPLSSDEHTCCRTGQTDKWSGLKGK